MRTVESKETIIDGLRTRYLQSGQGPPLLVVPGLLGDDASAGAEEDTDHEVFAPAHPGFWGSDPLPHGQELTIGSHSVRIGRFHEQVIRVNPISAMGFSAGATSLIHYAATHPGRVDKMVLWEPILRGSELPMLLKLLISPSGFPGATWAAVSVGPIVAWVVPWVKIRWSRRNRIVEGITTKRCAGEIARSLLRWDAVDELRRLRYKGIQVMIVHGSHQSLVPHSTLRLMEGGNITRKQIDGQGHFLNRDGYRDIVKATRDFLAPSGRH